MDFKRETAKLLAGASQNLAQGIASWSFEFWERKDFRLYLDFHKLSKSEQDRIFNELELSLLGLFVLHLDHAIEHASRPEQRIVFSGLQKDLPSAFLQLFINLGIEKQHIDLWKKLIYMRLKEYRRDFKTALKQSSKWEEFVEKEEVIHITWARIETITIDCLSHIRRGDVKDGDPLWKLLRKWFISLDAQLHPMTELALGE